MKITKYCLLIIAALLAGYVIIEFFSELITCIRWQAKALAINSISGGKEEAWWFENPYRIAAGLVLSNPQTVISMLGSGFLTFYHKIIMKKIPTSIKEQK